MYILKRDFFSQKSKSVSREFQTNVTDLFILSVWIWKPLYATRNLRQIMPSQVTMLNWCFVDILTMKTILKKGSLSVPKSATR